MSAFLTRFDNNEPVGSGMSQNFARRSAVISGMPASQQEVIAQSAKKDFQNRTQAVERQSQVDNNAAFSQGIQGIAKLLGTMQKAKQFQAKQQEQQAALSGGPQQASAYGVGNAGPQIPVPQPPFDSFNTEGFQGTSEDEALRALYEILYGNTPVGVPDTYSQYRKGY